MALKLQGREPKDSIHPRQPFQHLLKFNTRSELSSELVATATLMFYFHYDITININLI